MKHIGNFGILPAMPVVIAATEDNGKVNFAPHGQCATVSNEPSVIFTSVIKEHLTAKNIVKNGMFSINVPKAGQLNALKRCGEKSGNDFDKSNEFEVFRGNENFPMVADCSVCFVCKVVKTIEMNGFYIFFAEVLETYADEHLLSGDMPDTEKSQPILCSMDGKFWNIGEEIIV